MVLGCSEEAAVTAPLVPSPSDMPLSLLYKPQQPGAAALPHRWDCRKGVLGCTRLPQWLCYIRYKLYKFSGFQVFYVAETVQPVFIDWV